MEGKHSIVFWLGLCLLVSLCLWTVSGFRFIFFSPPLGDIGWLERAGVGYFSSLMLEKNRALWDISRWFLSSSLQWKQKRIFSSRVFWGNLAGACGNKSHNIVGVSCDTIPVQCLILRLVCVEPPAIFQVLLPISYPALHSQGKSLFQGVTALPAMSGSHIFASL